MNGLGTDRLTLREFTLLDAEFILDLLNQPSFIANIGDRGVRSLAEAESYLLNGAMVSYVQHGFGLWLVQRKSDQAKLGLCGLVKRKELPEVDLGYAFLPEFLGRGYAREAALGVIDHARKVIGLKRLLAIVSPGNVRSIRLLEKVGMLFEKTMEWPQDGSELKVFGMQL